MSHTKSSILIIATQASEASQEGGWTEIRVSERRKRGTSKSSPVRGGIFVASPHRNPQAPSGATSSG